MGAWIRLLTIVETTEAEGWKELAQSRSGGHRDGKGG